ncbi:tRNA pseudouridine(55) synthase TruB [Xylanivirga thermophila]|jgi:tRNA pseudouridine55 synthase|uniref:tRNA pseudouridine(55) synthase TruB n=1 Tax=Xylanivirga thermophila TaxID=2496273 RepID=UPI00101C9624|nr:tRNA pseudouridine(55) synthase TruB [Xylanivirga thermophila]
MNGIINVLKPPGMTSSNVVVYLRKLLKVPKVGHTGTLDPQAVGVLPICIGKATKLSDFLMSDRKTYIGELTLGVKTDTLDVEGKVISSKPVKCNIENIEEAFKVFSGDIEQIPPVYSAIKYKGQKLYKLAREGIEVSMPPREITIYKNEIIKYYPPDKVFFKVECSKGTYIRSLCRDIGDYLGCGAYMSFLMRSQSGYFDISHSYTLDEIEKYYKNGAIESFLIPMDLPLIKLKSIYISSKVYNKLLNGNAVYVDFIDNKQDIVYNEYVKVYCKGQFIGVGIFKDDCLKMKNVLL